MDKLIKRNSKKARDIFNNAINIKAYTLENQFTGRLCNRLNYQDINWLHRDWKQFNFSKLTTNNKGNYCLHETSNCWYEFDSINL